jgi:hypothetical protein
MKKLEIEGMYANIVKPMYDKPTANTILNGVKLKSFSLNSGIRQWCLHFPLLFNIMLEFLANTLTQDK